MAENLESPSFSTFGIENTMEMGMGNAELLNDLMSPETQTTNPDDLQKIGKEVGNDPEPPAPKAKAPIDPDNKEEDTTRNLTDFLLGDDEQEEEEDVKEDDKKPVAKADASEEDDADGDDDDTTDPVSGKFKALANDLLKLGVFTSEDDEDEIDVNSPEEFLERFQSEKQRGAVDMVNKFIGQFGEDYQQAFEAIFVKGVDPKEYFGTYNTIANFSEMDLSQESNQITVIKQALADQGFDQEDIDTELERLKNYGDLETVATKHHKVLVKKEAQKLQQLEAQAERELQQKAALRNQYINNVQSIIQDKLKTKEIDGIPFNPKLASELQDFLLVDKYKTTSGETLTDFDRTILELKRPENHAMKVKVALLLKILEKDPSLSTIQKTGVTKKSNELFGEVARQIDKGAVKSGKKESKPSSWFM
jgi:hypothetical protein